MGWTRVQLQTQQDILQTQTAMAEAEKELGQDGRLLIRESGTEPLIRVMAEALDPGLLDKVMDKVVGAVRKES